MVGEGYFYRLRRAVVRNKVYLGQRVRLRDGTEAVMIRVNGKPLCTACVVRRGSPRRSKNTLEVIILKPHETEHRLQHSPDELSIYAALAHELLLDAYGEDAAELAEEFAFRNMLRVPVSSWRFTLPEIFADILELKEPLSSPVGAREH